MACSLRLFNTFIATSIVHVLYCTNFTFRGAFVNEIWQIVSGATIYKITRFYLNSNYWDTPISTFSTTFVSEI